MKHNPPEKQKLRAIDYIQDKLGSGCSFIRFMYILRTFIFYPLALYLEINFVWYAIIFITRADLPSDESLPTGVA